MSTDMISNQTVKDALSTSVAKSSASQGRQNVAVQDGKALPQNQSAQQVSPEELAQVVEKLNDHVQQIERDLQFSIDDSSGRTVVRVVNSETEEVVRQIPSEEVLRISRNLQEQMEDFTGLIFETSA